jgi:hypothetical protein
MSYSYIAYIHKQSNESVQKHISSLIHSRSENASSLDDSNGMQRVNKRIIAGKFNVSTDYDEWKGQFFFVFRATMEVLPDETLPARLHRRPVQREVRGQ